jgi:hypothetical protein
MMELAGIDMLPPEAGIPWIRRELTAGGRRGEVLVAGRLGVLLQEWDAAGGLDTAALETGAADGAPLRGPLAGSIAGMPLHRGLIVETTLDPAVQPFLSDHRIEGTPVLPGVMGIEAFAEAASCMLPGWRIDEISDVEFAAPFKFYRGHERKVTVEALFHPKGDALVAECRLTGSRELPNQAEPQVTTHFTARVRLIGNERPARSGDVPPMPQGPVAAAADIYRLYFHGPAYQVLKRVWRDGARTIGEFAEGLPGNHVPPELPLLAAPRWIELCFQTAGIWEMSEHRRMGLPLHIDRLCLFQAPAAVAGRLFAIVVPHDGGSAVDAEVVDEAGNRYLELRGYRTVTLAESVDAAPLEAMRAAAA